ncbi:LOW QUALITY PROTEIN: hypothetical protein Syun_003107 [Stephania yunnanensis]|uniref:Uncharacterized protein n=1 Tax=Stephania yunnanensis TaxID=152371 RepID=A0AAP0Q0B6_9MAGN
MEVQQSKLTRTHSSLLRSSPTIRSSIQSLSSVCEEDEEEQKPHHHNKPAQSVGANRFSIFMCSVIAVCSFFAFFVFFFFFLFFFINLGKEEVPSSGNLILALAFAAAAATVFAAKSKRGLLLRQILIERNNNNRRIGASSSSSKGGSSVQWFIGNSSSSSTKHNHNQHNLLRHRKPLRRQLEDVVIREGVEFYSNGDFYEGEFHKGRCNGSGVYNYFVNGRYEGDWIDGRYDGYGIESWARGSKYRGQYRHGLRHGFGVYRFYTGDTYAGEWFNGQSHGLGAQTCADGAATLVTSNVVSSMALVAIISGDTLGSNAINLKLGKNDFTYEWSSEFLFRNGDRYAGEYFGDKIHGFGVYHFANGHCYEGSWHEGKKQGFGIYTFRNGETKCGDWDNGILKNPLPQLTDPVLRTVQAARKAAESAIHLRRVDDEVNRAVVAANKAATAARVAAIKAVQNRMDGKFCDTDVEKDLSGESVEILCE